MFTVLPHFVLRYYQIRPEVCAVIGHISPMALYRLVGAFGHQSPQDWLS
jgi:hypothetical protein